MGRHALTAHTDPPPDGPILAYAAELDREPEGTMSVVPCPCWRWAITPEMDADDFILGRRGVYHHPHCPEPLDRADAAAGGESADRGQGEV